MRLYTQSEQNSTIARESQVTENKNEAKERRASDFLFLQFFLIRNKPTYIVCTVVSPKLQMDRESGFAI